MSKNSLTPEQDLITREFFVVVAQQGHGLEDTPGNASHLRAICLGLLNYQQLPSGAFIDTKTKVTVEFGSQNYDAYPCEWEADARRANDAVNPKSEPETSPSSKSTYSKVRKAILSEDV